MQSIIKHEFNEHINVSQETIKSIEKPVETATNLCIKSLKKGNFHSISTLKLTRNLWLFVKRIIFRALK